MAYGLNKVMLIGNVGQDPKINQTTSGTTVANFSIATNESYKDQSGKLIEKVEWHNCVAWQKTAELVEKFVKKGSKLYVSGKLQTRTWEDKDGVKRYTTEIVVSDLMFLDSKRDENTSSEAQEAPQEAQEEPEEHKAGEGDDLPF